MTTSDQPPEQGGELRRIDPSDMPILPTMPPREQRRSDTARDVTPRGRPSPHPSSPARFVASPPVVSWRCAACRDSGWRGALASEVADRQLVVIERYPHPTGERLVAICPDCDAGRARAWAWMGLPDEASGVDLDTLAAIPDQDQAFAAIQEFVGSPTGWVTLAGGYGVGKTTLIYACLNAMAARGVFGCYWTAPSLIDHLRDALKDSEGRAHSERLKRLASVPVLAIDELDKFYATPYADEQIFKLFDARYRERRTLGTLVGYNRDRAEMIPPFLRSRIRDGRFRLIELAGADVRPALGDLDPWDRGE